VRLGNCEGVPEPPSHVQRTLRRGVLAVSELKLQAPTWEPSASILRDDASSLVTFADQVRKIAVSLRRNVNLKVRWNVGNGRASGVLRRRRVLFCVPTPAFGPQALRRARPRLGFLFCGTPPRSGVHAHMPLGLGANPDRRLNFCISCADGTPVPA
jgi:hypothetical protein